MKRKIGYVLFAATVGALVALAGPLNPPSGPVSSTGVSLPEIKQAVEAVQTSLGPGQLPSNVGYEVAGLPPDTLTTSLQTLVSGRQGVIKRIVIGSEFFPTTQGVELWVDGKFAGVYRGPTAATSASGIVEFAVFDVNIKFGSTVQAKVRLQQSSDKLSVAVHFLPTPPYVGYEVAGQPPDTLTTSLQTLVSGRQGVIKTIVVGSEFFLTTQGVELWVDGKFAGVYRGPSAVSTTSSVVEYAVFDANIKFNSTVQAKVRLLQSSDKLSVSVHYLPLP